MPDRAERVPVVLRFLLPPRLKTDTAALMILESSVDLDSLRVAVTATERTWGGGEGEQEGSRYMGGCSDH